MTSTFIKNLGTLRNKQELVIGSFSKERGRSESIVSIGTLSTEETNGKLKFESIDEQIDFMLGSIKKKPEVVKEKKKYKRKLKTAEQLEIFQHEISINVIMNHTGIKELALKTRLKNNQL